MTHLTALGSISGNFSSIFAFIDSKSTDITEPLFNFAYLFIAAQTVPAGDPITMFYLSFMAVLTLASNLLTDILYGVVDPRVRIS